MDNIEIPILMSGGNKKNFLHLLGEVDSALNQGVRGVCIGRNIFQDDHCREMSEILSRLVHRRISIQEAEQSYASLKEEYANCY